MTSTIAPPTAGRATHARDGGAPRRRTRVFALPEARWATAATVLFLLALPLQLAGAPAWAWGPLYALAYVTGGWEPGWEGLKALRDKTLDVDLLMIVAALGAASIGQVMDGALLVVIFATSGALEALATARTADSVRGLLDLAPATAVKLTGDGEQQVAVEELAVGDKILVRPGERVGADGRVLDGASDVDQATITGEPLPATKEPGDEVFAGTLNGTGALRVRVERDASDSVIARIVRMVEEASETKAPTQLFIEKVEQRYSLGMIAATLAVFFVPLAFGAELTDALLRAMTFMIVASPCAVVLATMPPLLSAIANAGRHGVLVKSAVVMERLGQVDAVALDKTGTLTEGTPRVTDIRPLAHSLYGEGELLALAAAAEHSSEHPLARAIVDAARERGLDLPQARDFTSAPGVGVKAVIDGRTVEVGAPSRLAQGAGHPASAVAEGMAEELEESGRTAVLVLVDGTPAGVLGLADRLRPDAAATVKSLAALTGSAPALLTGDNPRAAARLAAEAGIDDVRAGLLPQDKVSAVQEMEAAGRKVLVVGDGVNDAPALTRADIGIAIGSGTDVAVESADIILVKSNPLHVVRILELSRATYSKMVQNLVWATGYNVFAIPLAAGVLAPWGILLSPAVGALLMSLSTVVVAVNAQFLRRLSFS
jgi:heavy metal translocating P-type ATPase